ncbi:MAG: hypothetical protein FD129_1622, partial [bacterium]
MTGHPASGRFLPLLFLVILVASPGESFATRILVPEEMSLASAIDVAVAGDTLSLAPGSYERTPDPFIKEIVIEGRIPDDPPVLRRLEAGGVTLRHLHFEPDGPGGVNPVLLRLLGSAWLHGCTFRGFSSTAVDIRDELDDVEWLVVMDNCGFSELNVGIEAVLAHDGSRIEIRDTLFHDIRVALGLVTPMRDCPGGPPAEPPPLGGGPARIRVTGTTFSNLSEFAIVARNAAWALDMANCTMLESPLGIWLDRAGARIDHLDLRGIAGSSMGIRALSSRLEMTSSRVYQHAVGIGMTDAESCERPAGVIGGSPTGFCMLDMNTLALSTTSAVDADYNWWGTRNCSEAQEVIQGVMVQ